MSYFVEVIKLGLHSSLSATVWDVDRVLIKLLSLALKLGCENQHTQLFMPVSQAGNHSYRQASPDSAQSPLESAKRGLAEHA